MKVEAINGEIGDLRVSNKWEKHDCFFFDWVALIICLYFFWDHLLGQYEGIEFSTWGKRLSIFLSPKKWAVPQTKDI